MTQTIHTCSVALQSPLSSVHFKVRESQHHNLPSPGTWVNIRLLWQLSLLAWPVTQTIHTCSMALQSPLSSVHFKVRESQHHNLPSPGTWVNIRLLWQLSLLAWPVTQTIHTCSIDLQSPLSSVHFKVRESQHHNLPSPGTCVNIRMLWQLSLWAWPMTQTIHTCSIDLQSPLSSVHFKVRESQYLNLPSPGTCVNIRMLWQLSLLAWPVTQTIHSCSMDLQSPLSSVHFKVRESEHHNLPSPGTCVNIRILWQLSLLAWPVTQTIHTCSMALQSLPSSVHFKVRESKHHNLPSPGTCVNIRILWQLLLLAWPVTQTIHTCSMALQSPLSSVHFKVRESQHHNLPSPRICVNIRMLWQLSLLAWPVTQTIHTCSMALQSPPSSVHFKVRDSQHHNLPSPETCVNIQMLWQLSLLAWPVTQTIHTCSMALQSRLSSVHFKVKESQYLNLPSPGTCVNIRMLWQLSLLAWPVTQTIHTCSMALQSPLSSVHFKVRESQHHNLPSPGTCVNIRILWQLSLLAWPDTQTIHTCSMALQSPLSSVHFKVRESQYLNLPSPGTCVNI